VLLSDWLHGPPSLAAAALHGCRLPALVHMQHCQQWVGWVIRDKPMQTEAVTGAE
jgi:hypothetical protein